jgi:hypothetical protein
MMVIAGRNHATTIQNFIPVLQKRRAEMSRPRSKRLGPMTYPVRSFDLAISTESAFFSPFNYLHQMIVSLEALHSEQILLAALGLVVASVKPPLITLSPPKECVPSQSPEVAACLVIPHARSFATKFANEHDRLVFSTSST